MPQINLIQIETNVWVVLREFRQQPKAVIHKITDTTGADRYMVMRWEPDPAQRRMTGIYNDLTEAEKTVPWPSTRPNTQSNRGVGPGGYQ
ncbi:hypothetical protein G7068_11960 [Leucobacter viscericola]|uniref:Uncharacterized protein n=1 Tax=Leucobacter viscericola TaxID=2714935 RepID=A0A6G7XGU2_9MICO|nr:hypothetical protein [Leucobacter viscericola]QIK63824.1 hypothetical protein G7068_11960 [Leucobacter viscericola]